MTFWIYFKNNLISLWDYHLFSPFCWSLHISYHIFAALQCTAYYIFAALQCTEEYFNFVENQSIVVISYDKVWCQYLKIDNNLGVGEREGVN